MERSFLIEEAESDQDTGNDLPGDQMHALWISMMSKI